MKMSAWQKSQAKFSISGLEDAAIADDEGGVRDMFSTCFLICRIGGTVIVNFVLESTVTFALRFSSGRSN